MPDQQSTSFTPEEIVRVNRAMSAMPYSGGIMHLPRVSDVDGVVRWLEALGQHLSGVARRAEVTSQELQTLQGQREGFRAFLGLDEILNRLDEVAPED